MTTMVMPSRLDLPSNFLKLVFADLYGPSGNGEQPSANGATNGTVDSVKKRTVVRLSLCDALPAHGAISDMAFGLARNGVRL